MTKRRKKKPYFFSFFTIIEEVQCTCSVNSLPNNEILDWFKLEAFADDKMNAPEMMISL